MRRIHLKKMGCILPVLALLLALPGCNESGAADTEQTGSDMESGAVSRTEQDAQPTLDLKTYSWDEAAVYEAETGTLLGGTSVQEKDGVGYVEGFPGKETAWNCLYI